MTDAPITPEPVEPTPAPAYSAPAPAPAGEAVPGKTLGIVALILSILPFQLFGIILGFVARSQSKKVGAKNTPATAAIIVGFVLGALGIIILVVSIVGGALAVSGVIEQACTDQGLSSGTYELSDGTTITCP
jgi:hypothetical protein